MSAKVTGADCTETGDNANVKRFAKSLGVPVYSCHSGLNDGELRVPVGDVRGQAHCWSALARQLWPCRMQA